MSFAFQVAYMCRRELNLAETWSHPPGSQGLAPASSRQPMTLHASLVLSAGG